MIIYSVAIFTFMLALTNAGTPHPLSDEFIDMINSMQTSWKAGRNFPLDTPRTAIEKLVGALEDPYFAQLPSVTHDSDVIANLPDNFDSRNKWPNCPTLNEIRDQGQCGSCWAFGAVESMTDRYCIHSNGAKNFHFSAEDVLCCCSDCGNGCNGGKPTKAWQYWQNSGIVSGGNYKSAEGCRPYEIVDLMHGITGNRSTFGNKPTPKCEQSCQAGYGKTYEGDKKFGTNIAAVTGGEDNIRAEIFKNGPVEATYTVNSDFLNYQGGVYRHVAGAALGSHAIKIIGWGVENGSKYWLIANSWGTKFNNGGFFKMARGENHCGIESRVIAGTPLYND